MSSSLLLLLSSVVLFVTAGTCILLSASCNIEFLESIMTCTIVKTDTDMSSDSWILLGNSQHYFSSQVIELGGVVMVG